MVLPLLLVSILLGSATAVGAGAEARKPPRARARLVAEKTALAPGGEGWIALHLAMDEGWHVYWKNPGDSGTPPRIEWRVPDDLAVSDFHWPAPHRFVVGPLANYGYEDEVYLPMRVELAPGGKEASVRLEATAKWLVCKVECIPEQAHLVLEIPVTDGPAADSRDVDGIRAALAAVPRPAPGWSAQLAAQDERSLTLRAAADPAFDVGRFTYLFFPEEGGIIEPAADQTARLADGTITLQLVRSTVLPEPVTRMRGVLVATTGGEAVTAIALDAAVAPAASGPGLGSAAGLAFLGGLLLNLMPCVFPVLAIKVMSFARAGAEGSARALLQGLAFAAGILASFWALAGLLLLLRAGGEQIGWGFQLQSPTFVLALAFLFFGIAMVFLGVVDLGVNVNGLSGMVRARGGLTGSFLSGVLATAVATPCTAPFMGSALGYALVATPGSALAVFTALAAGMALPYVVFAASPRLVRALPRPGPWMETLQQVLAFPMLATVLWLLWVFGRQVGGDAQILALGGLLAAGFGFWVAGRFGSATASPPRRGAALAVAVLVIAGGFVLALPDEGAGAAEWVPYSAEGLAALRRAGRPVYVDFTASWCLTCQLNKRLVFGSTEVLETFRRHDVALMRADWTNHDPEITRALASFGRSGVPLNVLYGPDPAAEPVVLSTVLTPTIVLRAIEQTLGTRHEPFARRER